MGREKGEWVGRRGRRRENEWRVRERGSVKEGRRKEDERVGTGEEGGRREVR